jgi:hypothetical protein
LGDSRLAVALAYVLMMLPNTFSAHRSAAVILVEAAGSFTIISLIVASEGREPFRSLERPLIRCIGRLSYSFYLWHFFIMTIAVRAVYARLSAAAMHQFEIPIIVATAVATIAIALGVAQLSYRWIEMPSVALGRRLAGQWTRVAKTWRQPKAARRKRALLDRLGQFRNHVGSGCAAIVCAFCPWAFPSHATPGQGNERQGEALPRPDRCSPSTPSNPTVAESRCAVVLCWSYESSVGAERSAARSGFRTGGGATALWAGASASSGT